jgi:hypothetical protein
MLLLRSACKTSLRRLSSKDPLKIYHFVTANTWGTLHTARRHWNSRISNNSVSCRSTRTGQLSRYSDYQQVGRSGDRIPVGGRNFPHPYRPSLGDHPALQFTGGFPGVKWTRHIANHISLPTADGKERVELYLYSPLGLHGLFHGELYLHLSGHIWKKNALVVVNCTGSQFTQTSGKVYVTSEPTGSNEGQATDIYWSAPVPTIWQTLTTVKCLSKAPGVGTGH